MQREKIGDEYRRYMSCIRHYLVTKKHLVCEKRMRNAVLKATQHGKYQVDETGALLYIPPNTHIRQKIVTDEKEKEKILWQSHSAPHAGYSGINATVDKITQRFYWKGLKGDVKAYISKCDACQRYEKIKTVAPMLTPIKIVAPMHMVGMDLIGPLPETKNGYKYVMTLTDYFTKYVELYPLRRKTGECEVRSLKSFICRYGAPKKLLSDQGREFVNHINTDLAKKFNIDRMVTAAYHPQTNGLDER